MVGGGVSPCGGSIGDRLTSTIGYERMHQDKAQLQREDEFIKAVLKDLPPAPSYYARMKKVNASGAGILGCLPNVQPLDTPNFATAAKDENALILDACEIEAFGGAHIEGAMNIALRDEFPVWSGWILRPEHKILLVLDNKAELDKVQRQLLRIGIEKIIGFLRQEMRGWFEARMPFQKLRQLSVQELKAQQEDLQILDVRADGEWKNGHLNGALHAFVPKWRRMPTSSARLSPLFQAASKRGKARGLS